MSFLPISAAAPLMALSASSELCHSDGLLPVTSRHKPLGSGHLAASHCPSQPVLSLSISQLQALTLSRGSSCCSLRPLLEPPTSQNSLGGDFSSKIQKCTWAMVFFAVDLYDC